MSVGPTIVSFALGRNRHGQPFKLTGELQADGRYLWSLLREAANQRDDSVVIRDIPSDFFTAMADAVESANHFDKPR